MTDIQICNDAVIGALRTVYDGCCVERKISVVDMGLVDSVAIDGSQVTIRLVLTTGWCPFATPMLGEIRDRVRALPGVADATVEVDWNRPWDPARLDPQLAASLRLLPSPTEVADRTAFLTRHPQPVGGATHPTQETENRD